MKKVIIIFSTIMIGFSLQSQETKENKNTKVTFEVDGICGMCKKRIETAALKSKGVKFALWDVKSHQLNLIIDSRKTTVETIQSSILRVGHDVVGLEDEKLVATTEAYRTVHSCCRYRDEVIVLDD